MKIDSLLHRAVIYCAFCRVRIWPGDKLGWDHGVPDALDGAHDYLNVRPLHHDCHYTKTFGTKATTKGSDIHMIAAAKRIANGGKKRRGPKIKSRPFPQSHRPMQSRGFERRKI